MRTQVFASLLLLGAAALASAGDEAADPGRLDAVKAAPASHEVILENDRVRVLRVTIAPGVTEPVHTHEWPSVMRVESPQPLTYIIYAERAGQLVEEKRLMLPLNPPSEAKWMAPEGPHAVQNRGNSEYRAIRIEIKPPGHASDAEKPN